MCHFVLFYLFVRQGAVLFEVSWFRTGCFTCVMFKITELKELIFCQQWSLIRKLKFQFLQFHISDFRHRFNTVTAWCFLDQSNSFAVNSTESAASCQTLFTECTSIFCVSYCHLRATQAEKVAKGSSVFFFSFSLLPFPLGSQQFMGEKGGQGITGVL